MLNQIYGLFYMCMLKIEWCQEMGKTRIMQFWLLTTRATKVTDCSFKSHFGHLLTLMLFQIHKGLFTPRTITISMKDIVLKMVLNKESQSPHHNQQIKTLTATQNAPYFQELEHLKWQRTHKITRTIFCGC